MNGYDSIIIPWCCLFFCFLSNQRYVVLHLSWLIPQHLHVTFPIRDLWRNECILCAIDLKRWEFRSVLLVSNKATQDIESWIFLWHDLICQIVKWQAQQKICLKSWYFWKLLIWEKKCLLGLFVWYRIKNAATWGRLWVWLTLSVGSTIYFTRHIGYIYL